MILKDDKPIVATYIDLYQATAALHMNIKKYTDMLHDVWKRGAPTPDSIIRNPKGYDERQRQAGNREKRIIPPGWLAEWIAVVSQERGMPFTPRQCLNMALGYEDYGLDAHDRQIVSYRSIGNGR